MTKSQLSKAGYNAEEVENIIKNCHSEYDEEAEASVVIVRRTEISVRVSLCVVVPCT